MLEAFRQATGQTILERYGMTEIGMALSNPYDGPRVPGAVGRELPGVNVDIVDEAGLPAAVGEPGELRVRTPQMFSAYHGDAAATAASFDDDGRFRTGDTGTRDADGVVRLLGRTSIDIIKSGGYKLSALEIEAVLLEHPAVAEAAVTGVPDATWGERVTAWVVARGPTPPDAVRAAGVRARAPGPLQAAARAGAGRGAAPQCHGEGAEAAPGRAAHDGGRAMTDYGYVIVHHTTDPAQGEMLAELLRNEGIAARFRGAASTLIGLTKDLAPMAVEVPIGEEDRARQFLRDLENTAIVADSGGQAAPGSPQAPVAETRERLRGARRNLAISVAATLVLLGLTIILFNLG